MVMPLSLDPVCEAFPRPHTRYPLLTCLSPFPASRLITAEDLPFEDILPQVVVGDSPDKIVNGVNELTECLEYIE